MSQFENEDNFEALTNAQVEERERQVSLRLRELDLEIKEEQVVLLRQAKEQRRAKFATQQAGLQQFLLQRKARQAHCNHRKGGVGAEAVLKGEGQSAMACVIKHILPSGKYFVLCQRCGKEWHPDLTPLQNSGIKQVHTPGYFKALQLTTNNTSSGSSRFDFAVADPLANLDIDEGYEGRD